MLQGAAALSGCQASQIFLCCFGVMCVGTHVCMIVCGRHQRTTSDILLISSVFFLKNFLTEGLSLAWNIFKQARLWLTTEPFVSAFLTSELQMCVSPRLAFYACSGEFKLISSLYPYAISSTLCAEVLTQCGCSSHFSLLLEKPRFRPEGLEGRAFYNKASPGVLGFIHPFGPMSLYLNP